MQSKTEEFIAELELIEIQELHLRSFELYEEYSQRPIADTIRRCRQSFNETDLRGKRERLKKVEKEITNFSVWLEETKKHERAAAYYYSVSLKSLLLGLPVGVQIAQLFGIAIQAFTRKRPTRSK